MTSNHIHSCYSYAEMYNQPSSTERTVPLVQSVSVSFTVVLMFSCKFCGCVRILEFKWTIHILTVLVQTPAEVFASCVFWTIVVAAWQMQHDAGCRKAQATLSWQGPGLDHCH